MAEIIYRENVDDKYKADLTKIYASKQDFYRDLNKLKNEYAKEIMPYKGRLHNLDMLKEFLEKDAYYEHIIRKLATYTDLVKSLDGDKELIKDYFDYISRNKNLFFSEDEYLEFSEEYLEKIINDPELEDYSLMFKRLLSYKKSGLKSTDYRDSDSIMKMSYIYDNFDINYFKTAICLKDCNGKDVIVDKENELYNLKYNKDLVLRKNAYLAISEFEARKNEALAQVYIERLQKNSKICQTSGYSSSIQAGLISKDVDYSIVKNMCKSARENIDIKYELDSVRDFLFGAKTLPWDLRVHELVGERNKVKIDYSFDSGCNILKKALKPLGDDYVKMIDVAVKDRWIDVYPGTYKKGPSSQTCIYGLNPIIRLNYMNNLQSLKVFAHEFGHAMNSYYSNNNLTYNKSKALPLYQEVSSLTNEILLNDYICNLFISNKKERFLSLFNYISGILYTFFEYAKTTEFELFARDLCDNNKQINPQILNEKWQDLENYYNPKMSNAPNADKSWIDNITIFCHDFYGCSYSIDMICALKFANDILSGDKQKIENYRNFLTFGGSDSPVELLKKGGIDISSSETYNKAFSYIREKIAECKLLAQEIKAELEQEKSKTKEDNKDKNKQ